MKFGNSWVRRSKIERLKVGENREEKLFKIDRML